MKKSFKTEVFLTIPLILIAFSISCTSFITKQWVIGTASIQNTTEYNSDYEIKYNYGLFSGEKTSSRGFTKTLQLKVICMNAYCMLSCGKNKNDQNQDIENVLSEKPCDNSIATDSFYCDKKDNICISNTNSTSNGMHF